MEYFNGLCFANINIMDFMASTFIYGCMYVSVKVQTNLEGFEQNTVLTLFEYRSKVTK